ncbi:MAG: DUF819 family protein [Phycisphaerales bacterium]|nr:MAG: DUF819 family protein [Phycisphaerales bacterium]
MAPRDAGFGVEVDGSPSFHYYTSMLAEITEAVASGALIQEEAGLLAVLLAVLAFIFWFGQQPAGARIFRIVPSLVFCYFVPTTLTTMGIIPDEAPLYSWIKTYVLPASLLLLILSLDVPGIIRLGPKAVVMLLAGTAGVVVGGPIALLICKGMLPEDAWQGMAALCGSWIGGGANYVALGEMAGASDAMMGLMVIPDVFVANIWMGVLLYLSGRQHAVDDWTGADARMIRQLEDRMSDFHERTNRIASLPDLMMIVALAFVGAWGAYEIGVWLPDVGDSINSTTWKFIIVSAIGVGLSFTRARNLEGAGASKIGSVMLYLLVACIGAGADFRKIVDAPEYMIMGFIWMFVHVVLLLGAAWVIRAPIFFVAVGSQANIGGAASAPVVAAAYHPSLAPVGVLLAVAGYVLGTYAGLACMMMLKWIALGGS